MGIDFRGVEQGLALAFQNAQSQAQAQAKAQAARQQFLEGLAFKQKQLGFDFFKQSLGREGTQLFQGPLPEGFNQVGAPLDFGGNTFNVGRSQNFFKGQDIKDVLELVETERESQRKDLRLNRPGVVDQLGGLVQQLSKGNPKLAQFTEGLNLGGTGQQQTFNPQQVAVRVAQINKYQQLAPQLIQQYMELKGLSPQQAQEQASVDIQQAMAADPIINAGKNVLSSTAKAVQPGAGAQGILNTFFSSLSGRQPQPLQQSTTPQAKPKKDSKKPAKSQQEKRKEAIAALKEAGAPVDEANIKNAIEQLFGN